MADEKKTKKPNLAGQAKAFFAPIQAEGIADKNNDIDEYLKVYGPVRGEGSEAVIKKNVVQPSEGPYPIDLVNPNYRYGMGPGEKRIDVREMVRPLGGSMLTPESNPQSGPAYHGPGGTMTVPVYDFGGVVGDVAKSLVGGKAGENWKNIGMDRLKGLDPRVQGSGTLHNFGAEPSDTSNPNYQPMPMPVYDDGGEVNVNDGNHQVAVLENGERVLTPEQNAQYEAEHGAPVSFGGPVLSPEGMDPRDAVPRLDTEGPRPDVPVGAGKMSTQNAPLGGPMMNIQNPPAADLTGGKGPIQEASTKQAQPSIDAKQVAGVEQAKKNAVNSGDMAGLATAMIQEKFLKSPQAFGGPITGLPPTPSAAGEITPGAGATGVSAPMNQGPDTAIPAAPAARPTTPEEYKSYIEGLKDRIFAAHQIHTPESQKEAGFLQKELDYAEKKNPWGSALNHPGLLGKVAHGAALAGEVAGQAIAPQIMSAIPGTLQHREMQESNADQNIKAAGEQQLQAAQTAEAQARTAETEARVPYTEAQTEQIKNDVSNKLKEQGYTLQPDGSVVRTPGMPEPKVPLQDALGTLLMDAIKKDNGDYNGPDVRAVGDLIKMQKLAGNEQEAFVQKYLADNHLPDNSENRAKGLKAYADATQKPVQFPWIIPSATPGGPVKVITGKGGETLPAGGTTPNQAGKFDNQPFTITSTDPDGTKHVKLVKGSDLSADQIAEAIPVKPDQLRTAAQQAGVVQEKMNDLRSADLSIFDDPVARNAVTLLTSDGAGGIGLNAGGESIGVHTPGFLNNMLQRGAVNSQFDNSKAGQDLKKKVLDYATKYWAAKDGLLAAQMMIQGGKIGRGNQQYFEAMMQQLPGPQVFNSDMAKNQLGLFQKTLSRMESDLPDDMRPNVSEMKPKTPAKPTSFADWQAQQKKKQQ